MNFKMMFLKEKMGSYNCNIRFWCVLLMFVIMEGELVVEMRI